MSVVDRPSGGESPAVEGDSFRDLAGLSVDELHREREAQDRRLTPLFRRWPALSADEHGELKVVYEKRQRLARYLGWLRLRRRSTG